MQALVALMSVSIDGHSSEDMLTFETSLLTLFLTDGKRTPALTAELQFLVLLPPLSLSTYFVSVWPDTTDLVRYALGCGVM